MGMGGENGEEKDVLVVVGRKPVEGQHMMKKTARSAEELATVVGDMVVAVADAIRNGGKESVEEGLEGAMKLHAPRLKQATHRVGADVVQWMQQGGLWRSLLVMAVGLISVTAVTGLTAFLMVVLLATANAVIIGFLMCLSAVGAFLAMFCTLLTFIYIGALAATAFAIGTAVFMASCAVLFFTGWILFAWVICEAIKKSLNLVRGTLATTSGALTGVSKKQDNFVA